MSSMSIDIVLKFMFRPIGTAMESFWPANLEKKGPNPQVIYSRGEVITCRALTVISINHVKQDS
jgi:hypothetical protein